MAPAVPALIVKHFGAPLLSEGGVCEMAIRPSQRHNRAWEILFAALTTTADLEEAVQAFRARIASRSVADNH